MSVPVGKLSDFNVRRIRSVALVGLLSARMVGLRSKLVARHVVTLVVALGVSRRALFLSVTVAPRRSSR